MNEKELTKLTKAIDALDVNEKAFVLRELDLALVLREIMEMFDQELLDMLEQITQGDDINDFITHDMNQRNIVLRGVQSRIEDFLELSEKIKYLAR